MSFSALRRLRRGHSNHTPAIAHDDDHDRIHHNLLQTFYAFSEIEEDGGALQLIPESHKANFPLPHDVADMLVETPMPTGSVRLFSHDTHHRSRNRSQKMRRTVVLTYCPGVIANTLGGDGLYNAKFEAAPEDTWLKYLLRRLHGIQETYPKPEAHPVPTAQSD